MNNNMYDQRQRYPQTKLCKHCRSEMDVRAAVCPNCRKKQSNPLLTVILIIAAVFIGVPFLTGFLNGVSQGVSNSTGSQNTITATSPKREAATRATTERTTETVEAVTEPQAEKTTLTITGHHLSKDYADRDVLVVEYDFYNGEDKPKSFMWLFDDKCFQNGVSCDDWPIGVDEINSDDASAEVQPGYTHHIAVGYELRDMSDVNIVVEKTLNSDIVYVNETLSLQ